MDEHPVPGQANERHGGDPRVYMAAERTFLAWIRTALALMALGFVVARFGIFLRSLTASSEPIDGGGSTASLALGLGLVSGGAVLCLVAARRFAAYVRGIDRGRFRAAFGSRLAVALAALLFLAGAGLALFLALK